MTALELAAKKAEVIAERAKLAEQLAIIKPRMVDTLPLHVFTIREKERRQVVAEIQKCDAKISAIKSQLHLLVNAPTTSVESSPSNPAEKHWLRELIDMRDGYQAFAADATRSPTMRRMASEFIMGLNPIIRRELNKKG